MHKLINYLERAEWRRAQRESAPSPRKSIPMINRIGVDDVYRRLTADASPIPQLGADCMHVRSPATGGPHAAPPDSRRRPTMRKIQRAARIDPYDSPEPMGISGGLASYGDGGHLHVDRLRSKPRTAPFVYLLTTLSALGGFLLGYDTGVISGALILLRDVFHLSIVWQELIVGVTIGAAAVFALIAGGLNDSVGRRPVIIAASLIFTGGALCMAVATDRFMLLSGRLLVGAGIGKSRACTHSRVI